MVSKSEIDEKNFFLGIGEFSVRSEEAFEKHLARLDKYVKSGESYFEPVWYRQPFRLKQ